MKFRFVMIGLVLFLLASQGKAEEVLILGDLNYKPIIYQENGQAKGILPDILQSVAKDMQISIGFKLLPWKRAYNDALNGDGGVVGLSMTDERLKLFDYSDVIYNDDINIVVLKDKEFEYHSIADLKGKKIGGQLGASYGEQFDQALAQGLVTIERDNNHGGRLKKLLVGRLDCATIGNGRIGFLEIIKSDPKLSQNKDKFVLLHPLTTDPLYLGFAKSMNRTDFLSRFNAALQNARENGVIETIIDNYIQ